MERIYIGKIVNTHGIKGELRIISDFQFKDRVFKVGNKLFINNKYYQITTYRHHKMFEMVTLDDFNNINDVLFLKNQKVYFDKEELELNSSEVLDSDLINYKVVHNDKEYKIIEVFDTGNNKIIRALIDEKEVLIPFNSPMIIKIDKENKLVYTNLIDGVI